MSSVIQDKCNESHERWSTMPLLTFFKRNTLPFGRIFAKFEDLGVVHVGDQVLRFFAELVDLLRLSQILNE